MNKEFKYYFLMILATIMWAGAFIAGKLGINQFSPVVITFLRLLFASIIIFPIMKYKYKENWIIKKENILLIFSLGFIGMTGYHLLFFSALKYTTASNAAIINAFNPLITAVLATIILKERISFKKIILIIIAFLGVLLTITNWDLKSLFVSGLNRGDFLMLMAATCWAIYSIIVKKGVNRMEPLILTTYTFISCVVILMPFALKEIIFKNALNVTSNAYLAVIYMAVFPTVMGYTIQQFCIKEIGPSTTALFINLTPVFTIIMALIFLHEQFFLLNIVSISIIIISVFMFTRIGKKGKV